jgi:hypothetical protein
MPTEGMDVDRTEVTYECDLLLGLEGLVPEEERVMFHQEASDRRDFVLGERLSQVDSGDQRTDRRGQPLDREIHDVFLLFTYSGSRFLASPRWLPALALASAPFVARSSRFRR